MTVGGLTVLGLGLTMASTILLILSAVLASFALLKCAAIAAVLMLWCMMELGVLVNEKEGRKP